MLIGILSQTKTDYPDWAIGDPIWLSSTPGVATDVRPSALNARVGVLGRVMRVHATQGEILVRVNYADEAFPNVVPVDITVTGRINGRLDQGVMTRAQICQLQCPAMPCTVYSSDSFEEFHSTSALTTGAYMSERNQVGPCGP
jgi:hypothetical protein